MEIKFKPGDRVRFKPRVGRYDPHERNRAGQIAVVRDSSDIPTIAFVHNTNGNQPLISAALQEDLVRCGR